MTDQQKQHLTQLIKTSAILNAQEREEWLMLLDLMNDKQVGELERILTPATPFANGAASPGAKPAPANLPMTHIVNLPKPPQPKPAQDKTLSKFAEHLNQILAEKDLPPSEQKSPLDLPKGETKPPAAPKPKPQPPAVAPAPPAPTEVREAQPKSSIYDIMPVVVEQPIYLKKSLPPKVAPAPPEDLDGYGRYDKSTEERVQSPAVSGKIINKILDSEHRTAAPEDEQQPDMADLSDIESLKIKPKAQPGLRSGLQNNSQLFQTAILRPQGAAVAGPETGQSEELSKAVKLDDSADAALLSLPEWRQESPAAFAKRLKKIIGRRGYYDVIFNLQKSPLYSSYIDSGLKSLAAATGKSFEALGENYMSKKQFEDFTDLLRELQV